MPNDRRVRIKKIKEFLIEKVPRVNSKYIQHVLTNHDRDDFNPSFVNENQQKIHKGSKFESLKNS